MAVAEPVPARFHPLVEDWFQQRFGTPTEPQAAGWPAIAAGLPTLIAAPTGSGKTLTAFLAALDRLIRRGLAGALPDATDVIYVSPLKALANDVQKNLEQPLRELTECALAGGRLLPPIRVAVRSGDTLPAERAAMLRRPPHILITTPESLYLLLTAAGSRRLLRSATTVILDEIHALVPNKRGAHLALSLERLDALAGRPLQRIGLSATARPLPLMADFLVGAGPAPRIVAISDRRRFDLGLETPASELGPIATNEHWEERYERLTALAQEHRSTLVFVPTRRMAERVAHRMRERLGEDNVAAHHGSLSRALRLRAEERFKAGRLAMMVATASLELGLDIGAVDLVCQLGSPRQLAAAWQRVGRAGHWRGAIPKARFFPLTRDDLIECAALIRALLGGSASPALEELHLPPWPRDILAQQIVATVASEEDPLGWDEAALLDLARRAAPYRDLPSSEYEALLQLLSDGISSRRGRRGAFLHRDGVHHRLRPRRGARLAAITGGGAIAETATYAVQAEPENLNIGSLDEDFAIESNAGDIILLGTHSWRVKGVETGRVRVEDAHGAPPTVPFWLGEAPGRSREFSQLVSDLRHEIATDPAQAWVSATALTGSVVAQAQAYIRSSHEVLGTVPTTHHLVAERFFDDAGGMQLVIHAPFGAAINKAWGMALRKRFCRGFDFELQASASDNGLALALGEQHSFPLESIFGYLTAAGVEAILEQAVLQAPIFGTRWRWVAGRALALLRFAGGRKVAPQIQRMRSEDLLAAAFPMQLGCQDNHGGEDLPIPDHPYVREAMRDCLHEFLDLNGLKSVLAGLAAGSITFTCLDTAAPSPLAAEILNVAPYGFLDEAPLEERRSRAVNLRPLAARSEGSPGRLDPEAVAAVCAEAAPAPRTADEMHDLLLSLVRLPDMETQVEWRPWLRELALDGRALRHGDGWVAAERYAWIAADTASPALAGPVWPGVEFAGARMSPRELVTVAIVGGWMEILGPITVAELAPRLGLDPGDTESAMLALEGQGRAVRGPWLGEPAWCERALLARIHRRMVRRLRAEIEPVAPAVFSRFLTRWQHLDPGSQLHGASGLEAVLEQLQGLEAPASAWESSLLPARIADYEPELLDQLCMSGVFAWARLHPSPSARRAIPTRNSPITFFRREAAAWLLQAAGWKDHGDRPLSPVAAEVADRLQRRGASFFMELTGHGLVPSQVEAGLWELVAAGRATADGFDGLRAFLDPKRRAGQGRASHHRPRHSGGRWSLLAVPPCAPDDATGAAEARRARLAEQQALLWLRRYGVLFRLVVERESSALGWYEVLLACRRLEARGEIRGGRFVSGFAGEQYALPQAVEALRSLRRLEPGAHPSVAAADPLADWLKRQPVGTT